VAKNMKTVPANAPKPDRGEGKLFNRLQSILTMETKF
jgi:hypothetical protein